MKKSFLFGLLAIGLAGFGFGGVSLADEIIGIANCNITKPVAGSLVSKSVTVPEGANYTCTFNSVNCSSDSTNWRELENSDTYLAGDRCEYRITITANNGYELNESSTTFTINDESATKYGSLGDRQIQYDVATVCRIGNKYYPSLAIAAADAEDGATIILLDDITINHGDEVVVENKITLDMNGKTINSTYMNPIYVEADGDLTITGNGTINGPTNGAAFDSKVVISVDGGKLTYLNGTLNAYGAGSDGMYGVYVLDGGTAIFGNKDDHTGPNITAHFAAIGENHMTAPGNIIVYGGTYTANVIPNPSNVRWYYFASAVYAPGAGTIDIRGGTFNGYYGISDRYLDVEQTLTISGATFNSSNMDIFIDEVNGSNDSSNRLIKSSIPSLSIPDKYVWVKDGDMYKAVEGFTVSFNSNGGSDVESQTAEKNTITTKPENPTKEKSVLGGWFKEAGLENERNFDSDTVTGNITLYAKWEAMTSTAGDAGDDATYASGFVFDAEEGLNGTDTQASVEAAVASNNSTAVMEGVAELVVYSDEDDDGNLNVTTDTKINTKVNFQNPVVIKIPVTSTGSVKVKVRHNGETKFGIDGLTRNNTATCTNGVATNANDRYDGSAIPVNELGYVEIYTCSASTFVAYSETKNSTPSSSGSGGSGKASGGSSSSSSTDTSNNTGAKADTGTVLDTEKGDADTSDSTATEDLHKVLEDGYTVEFHNAYEFAFKNGITTMPSIDEAHMNSPLTRIAMAKMLSQYAINVLGKKPANVVVPNFPDVSPELDAEYNNGVTLAYQLGIMGINITEFRPDDLVTRAEFATALSRLLYNTSDGEGAYYETHLQKLMEEKIITNANPDLQELRGYVMIMLMRSASK